MSRAESRETIYAPATATGIAGVAVIRISGKDACKTLQCLSPGLHPRPRYAHYCSFYAEDGRELIDRGLALYFPAPASFTGEDCVELHLHGGRAVMRHMLATLAQMPGVRFAEAGEFSRRAVLNGKMDVLAAEGIADMIQAETLMQKRQAMEQMAGLASRTYESLRLAIIESLALLEATIDFPDEDIPDAVHEELRARLAEIHNKIHAILSDERRGERLREGLSVVILGAPNAGKSSLMNTLAQRDVAIVSSQAGTTRDVLEVHLDLNGLPVVLVDTAGLRDSPEPVEQEGIRRARQRAQAADLRLIMFDGERLPDVDGESLEWLGQGGLAVVSKSDVLIQPDAIPDMLLRCNFYPVSTRTGEGVAELLSAVEQRLHQQFFGDNSPLITRERHRTLLEDAQDFIDKSLNNHMLEMKCEQLRQAALAVGKITGKIYVDDVLDSIFSRFCIGK